MSTALYRRSVLELMEIIAVNKLPAQSEVQRPTVGAAPTWSTVDKANEIYRKALKSEALKGYDELLTDEWAKRTLGRSLSKTSNTVS